MRHLEAAVAADCAGSNLNIYSATGEGYVMVYVAVQTYSECYRQGYLPQHFGSPVLHQTTLPEVDDQRVVRGRVV